MNHVSYEMQQLDLLASTTYVGTLPMKEDLSSVFCTELLAASYKRMGLLSPNMNPTKALPRSFTSNQRLFGKLPLLRGAILAPEVRIRCERTQDELQTEYETQHPTIEKIHSQQIPQSLRVEGLFGYVFFDVFTEFSRDSAKRAKCDEGSLLGEGCLSVFQRKNQTAGMSRMIEKWDRAITYHQHL